MKELFQKAGWSELSEEDFCLKMLIWAGLM